MSEGFSYVMLIGYALENELIQTDKVYIRRFKETDMNDFCDYAMNKKLCRDLGWAYMNTREECEAFFKKINIPDSSAFAIVHKESGKVIGNFGVGLYRELLRNPILNRMRGITFSFALSEKYHNQGIMTELLKTVCTYFFQKNIVDYVNCGYFYFNEASKRVQQKVGFQYYGEHILTMNGEEIRTIENLLFRY